MFVETASKDGPVAMVSQAGGGPSVPYGLLSERGIGVRYRLAIGNQRPGPSRGQPRRSVRARAS
jgi:hypothetical protein